MVGFCWQNDDLVFERTLIYTVDSMCIFDLLVATVFNFFLPTKRLKGVQKIVVIRSFNELLMFLFEG